MRHENKGVIKNFLIKYFYRYLINFSYSIANSEPLSSTLITADSVKTYLGEHPEFLDTYVEQNVHSNTIQQWISKKPQKISSRPSSSTSMPIVSLPLSKNSISTIKNPGKTFCRLIYDFIYDIV